MKTKDTKGLSGLLQHRWIFMGLLWAGSVLGGYRKNAVQLTKIKGALYYLKAIQSLRLGFLVLFQVVLCFIFFITGIVLVHLALFRFLSEGPTVRVWTLLGIGALELLPTIAYIGWFLSSARWFKWAKKVNPTLAKTIAGEM